MGGYHIEHPLLKSQHSMLQLILFTLLIWLVFLKNLSSSTREYERDDKTENIFLSELVTGIFFFFSYLNRYAQKCDYDSRNK